MERIEFLEKKIKEQNDEHHEDSQKYMGIISRSKEIFKHIFEHKEDDGNSTMTSEAFNTTIDTTTDK